MMDFFVKIKDWWAVEALIASYNYANQIAYKTVYETIEPVGVIKYGSSQVTPYQIEFLALSPKPRVVSEAIQHYPMRAGDRFILKVFHASPAASELKAKYISLGYDIIRTDPILARDLPPKQQRNKVSHIHKADTVREVSVVNESLSSEGEGIPLDSLGDESVHNFYARVSDHIVGWIQMITVYPNVGYIHHMYTMTIHRGVRVGSALVERAQVEAVQLGLQNMVMIPSEMAFGLATRLGYRPLAYFTTFRLADEEKYGKSQVISD